MNRDPHFIFALGTTYYIATCYMPLLLLAPSPTRTLSLPEDPSCCGMEVKPRLGTLAGQAGSDPADSALLGHSSSMPSRSRNLEKLRHSEEEGLNFFHTQHDSQG